MRNIHRHLIFTFLLLLLFSFQALAVTENTPKSQPDPTSLSKAPSTEQAIESIAQKPKVDTKKLPCMSFGSASKGRLVNGTPLPSHKGWINRSKERQYSTPDLIEGMTRAMDAFLKQYPKSARLVTGDVSRPSGGPLLPHRSHQSGRDIDIGMYAKDNRQMRHFEVMTKENMDVAKTWTLIESLLEHSQIEYILVDYSLQEPLYQHAKNTLGASEEYLNRVFQYPMGSKERKGIIRHSAGHKNHLHVRFFAPKAVAAARKYENMVSPNLADLNDPEKLPAANQVTYVPRIKKNSKVASYVSASVLSQVRSANSDPIQTLYIVTAGDSLAKIAKKYALSVDELRDLNDLQPNSALHPGMALRVGREEVDNPVGNDQLIARFGRSKKVHKVEPGDTIWSIAQTYEIQVADLCQWNDLTPRTLLEPGQSVYILLDRPIYATMKFNAMNIKKVQTHSQRTPWSLFKHFTTAWHHLSWAKVKNLFRMFL